MEVLKKLQEQDEGMRRRLVWLLTATSMALVLAGWIFYLRRSAEPYRGAADGTKGIDTASAVTTLKDEWKETKDTLSPAIGGLTQSIEELTEALKEQQ
ncbi:MAG: hypothetical protein A2939_03675 [Parcubacteria group bacterium RIFCSPLOWO2_01_FULL_48_18]|nr:MAG: hypothetical protein A3J67_02615 [Parcubacteria group bacterium RIFCSPHIGHO2_02_FULL_48_10b]OHB22377.1 MAG: hypothetical protein A2939_03675 [Parcubacteria group bacterium RIFCSPLOWO2_01_FULL_48_18]